MINDEQFNLGGKCKRVSTGSRSYCPDSSLVQNVSSFLYTNRINGYTVYELLGYIEVGAINKYTLTMLKLALLQLFEGLYIDKCKYDGLEYYKWGD